MKKIISLFKRNHDGDRKVRNEVSEGAEWVINGEGVATRKFDGTCCLIKGGKFYKRYEVKKGKITPANFDAACEVDPITGKQQGWVPVMNGDPQSKWHLEAREAGWALPNGTYELVGPKVNGNPEKYDHHILIKHGEDTFEHCPRDYEGLKHYLGELHFEGIVWHHPDGRMVKIKAKDFPV